MTGKSHCLFLATDAFGGGGGIAQYNRDLSEALALTGALASITVLPRYAPVGFNIISNTIEQLSPRPTRLGYTIAALHTALTQRVDIVYCGHVHLAALAAVIAWFKKATLVIQAHGIEVWLRPSLLRKFGIQRASIAVCVSRDTRSALLEQTTLVSEKVVVLANTVGPAFSPDEGRALRTVLGLESKKLLLTVSRLDSREQYKGHNLVIAAIPFLVSRGHDVVYIVVGDGDGRAHIEKYALSLGVSDRVLFLGAVEVKTLVEAYRAADLFVMPSTGEGFGIVYLESLACGTPVLALNIGGARDALADGQLGTLVASADELPITIDRILTQPKIGRSLLAGAVQARFGRGVFQEQVSLVLHRILEAA